MTSKKPKVKTQRTKVVCLSHKEDADGISSAALIREAFGGDTVLEDYPGLMDALEKIKNDEKIKQLFICDLGLSNKTQDEFVQVLSELRKNKVSITYIDHHDLDAKIIRACIICGSMCCHYRLHGR